MKEVMDKLVKIHSLPKHLKDYCKFSPKIVEKILEISPKLLGLKVNHISATSLGGGVAEMLHSDIALENDLGLEANWYVVPPDESFFEVTKQIHNFLQGKEGDLTDKQKSIYLNYNQNLAKMLDKIDSDILVIHDPQPAAALSFMKNPPAHSIWRSHIDTSSPNKAVWDFILPYLLKFKHFIFTLPEYTNNDFPLTQTSFITPAIDPLSPKNKLLSQSFAKRYISKFGIDPSKPLISQISRLDPWKDPIGVIEAFSQAKDQIPNLQLALVAQQATDDPEGVKIQQQVEIYIEGRKHIFLLVNLPDNDLAVNAFQTASDIILQKSLREGFGLTVTESMYKGAVVIGGNVGGIKYQIKDGINGFLVDSIQETAQKIIYILKNPHISLKISQSAHKSVCQRFLTPEKILQYLNLFKDLLENQLTQKDFLTTKATAPFSN